MQRFLSVKLACRICCLRSGLFVQIESSSFTKFTFHDGAIDKYCTRTFGIFNAGCAYSFSRCLSCRMCTQFARAPGQEVTWTQLMDELLICWAVRKFCNLRFSFYSGVSNDNPIILVFHHPLYQSACSAKHLNAQLHNNKL